MEFCPHLIALLGNSPTELLQDLIQSGFKLFEIRRNGDLMPVLIDSIDAFAKSVTKLTNILALKGQWESESCLPYKFA